MTELEQGFSPAMCPQHELTAKVAFCAGDCVQAAGNSYVVAEAAFRLAFNSVLTEAL